MDISGYNPLNTVTKRRVIITQNNPAVQIKKERKKEALQARFNKQTLL